MKITTFNPQIVTRDAESVVELFEKLGFERHHVKEDIGELAVTGIRMKDADGNYLDISQSGIMPEHDLTAIRMNVDDFEAAYELLVSRGFKNAFGNETVNTKSSKSVMMVAPSGFVICIVHHIKDHD